MNCPDCDGTLVGFAVPPSLREYAPGETGAAAICARCLRVHPAAESPEPDRTPSFDAVAAFFPEGEGGVALALALGLLGSLALNRDEVEALLGHAERAGADPFLALDRLAAAGTVEGHFDVARRRDQLEQLL